MFTTRGRGRWLVIMVNSIASKYSVWSPLRHGLQFLRILYIKDHVRPQNSNGPYASFYALVKDFLEFDSIQPIRRLVGKGPMLQEES
jgi:hypothetical protein